MLNLQAIIKAIKLQFQHMFRIILHTLKVSSSLISTQFCFKIVSL